VLATSAAGCPCVDSAVNSSPWLRWKIFAAFGAGRLCTEMTKRGAALRLLDTGPVVGRYFPSTCQSTVNDDRQTVTLQFSGDGYAWTPVSKRIGFASASSVEYKPDFHVDGDTVYVWFQPSAQPTPTFDLRFVEQPVVGLATQLTPLGAIVNLLARQIETSELARGFTVIHESSGDDFALGILQPPARPPHPYSVHGSGRVIFANDTTEVHAGGLDFIGPFEIDQPDRVLFTQIRVDGPPVDIAIIGRSTGEAWRAQYQMQATVPLPPSPPLVAGPVMPGGDVTRSVPLPPGQYYLVIDNSPVVGEVAPPPSLFDPVARVTYAVWMADRG
jgi:hypothetical protein